MAKIENSPRLRRVASLLADGRAYSTLEILRMARVCAVNTCVHELRQNGYDIECQRRGKTYYYRYIGRSMTPVYVRSR